LQTASRFFWPCGFFKNCHPASHVLTFTLSSSSQTTIYFSPFSFMADNRLPFNCFSLLLVISETGSFLLMRISPVEPPENLLIFGILFLQPLCRPMCCSCTSPTTSGKAVHPVSMIFPCFSQSCEHVFLSLLSRNPEASISHFFEPVCAYLIFAFLPFVSLTDGRIVAIKYPFSFPPHAVLFFPTSDVPTFLFARPPRYHDPALPIKATIGRSVFPSSSFL